MMYYLHRLSDHFIGFNVFLYVTFRAIAAAVTAFVGTLMFGNFIIRMLIALKLGQPIREAAEVHRLAELHGVKQGTPTMGGVLVIGAVFVASVMWARLDNQFVWLALFSMVYLGGLGFADDYLKVTKKKSDGISGRIKLVCQITLAAIVTGVFLTNPVLEVQARALYVPFVKAPVIANMSWFTFVFFALVIVGSSNAVNLTDGLDGLATGCTITVAFAYALLSYAAGNFRIAEYLQVPFYPFAGELTVVCSALIGQDPEPWRLSGTTLRPTLCAAASRSRSASTSPRLYQSKTARVFQPPTAMQSASLSPAARRFVAAVLRVWWNTYPPAFRPTGNPAASQAVAHALWKVPTHP